MFLCFFTDPLGNSDFFHAHRIWNYIGVIANAVDNRFCAELSKFITGELFTLIAARNIMVDGTVQKSVVSTIFAALTNKVRETPMTNIRECRTCPAEQSTDGRTLFIWDSFHNKHSPN